MSEGAFEAKVSAKRETSAGIFITLQVQPDDFTADLATLRVGSALQVGWAEIVDTSVQSYASDRVFSGTRQLSADRVAKLKENHSADELPKPKRAWADLSHAEQCGIVCEQREFWRYLLKALPVPWQRYPAEMPAGAVAADIVREHCGVKSRSELNTNPEAAEKWRKLESEYQSWLTDQRYGYARR